MLRLFCFAGEWCLLQEFAFNEETSFKLTNLFFQKDKGCCLSYKHVFSHLIIMRIIVLIMVPKVHDGPKRRLGKLRKVTNFQN